MSPRPIRLSVATRFFLIRLKTPAADKLAKPEDHSPIPRPGRRSPRAASRLADHAGRSPAGRGQLVIRGYARWQAARGRAGRAPGTRPDYIPAGRAGQILAEG
jgi:hypothetical protein